MEGLERWGLGEVGASGRVETLRVADELRFLDCELILEFNDGGTGHSGRL